MSGSTDVTLHWVESLDDANNFITWLGERRPWLAVDTETSGLDWWRDVLRTVQFGDKHVGWCLEWNRWSGLILEALAKYDRPIVMQNQKFDTHFLEVNGVPLKRWLIHDTRAMAHLIDPVSYTALKMRAAKVLGNWALHGQEELKLAMMKGGWTFATVPVELLWKYAAFDCVLTAQLAEEFWPEITSSYSEIYGLEIASTQVLTDMERRGILTDRRYLESAYEDWGRELASYKHRAFEEFGIQNPNSDKQVISRLRQDGWKPVVFSDKGNPKLDNDVLSAIGHPLTDLVLDVREYSKLRDTYCKNLIELSDANGRLHASINPLGARTGRMSVSRPSLQNLPAKDARIRDAFISEQGMSIITADYDQIEMRIFAHYAQSPTMLEAIRYGDWMTSQGHEGYDMHSMNARMVYGIGVDTAVPAALRKQVKGVGFAKVYGAGLETFSATAGLTLSEGRSIIEAYERAFPETRKEAFPQKIAATLWDRQRRLNDPYVLTAYGRKEPCFPSDAFKAVNYLCQGTAADVLKAKLIDLSRTWLGDHMLLPIHDEILFEVPDDAVGDALATIHKVMPENNKFAVPISVGAEALKRWGDKKDYHPNGVRQSPLTYSYASWEGKMNS